MKQQDLSIAKEKISSGFKDLSLASNKLKSAADDLFATISELEKLLKSLNLRVSAWHQVARSIDEDGTIRTRSIGYTNIDGQWVIAINKAVNDQVGEYNEETWRFADAPLWMCADAISELPGLIQALLKRTVETTEKIKAKNQEAIEIVAATAAVAAEIVTTTGRPK
jgi:hypothetical protein